LIGNFIQNQYTILNGNLPLFRSSLLARSHEVFLISKEEDFDLICSPVRASVLEALVAFGPMSNREIALRLGRSATLIHHHVGILLRGGLVREHDRQKRGKHLERVFALRTEDWQFDYDSRPEVMAVLAHHSRITLDDLGDALDDPAVLAQIAGLVNAGYWYFGDE